MTKKQFLEELKTSLEGMVSPMRITSVSRSGMERVNKMY